MRVRPCPTVPGPGRRHDRTQSTRSATAPDDICLRGAAEAAYAGKDAEGHPVVVTVVRPVDPDAFLRTMGVVATVRHLDLAPVVDAGREGPDCYVVGWDYGEVDAAAMVARGPLPPADAALVGAAAAAGLAALHERGVVHGGVDPSSARARR